MSNLSRLITHSALTSDRAQEMKRRILYSNNLNHTNDLLNHLHPPPFSTFSFNISLDFQFTDFQWIPSHKFHSSTGRPHFEFTTFFVQSPSPEYSLFSGAQFSYISAIFLPYWGKGLVPSVHLELFKVHFISLFAFFFETRKDENRRIYRKTGETRVVLQLSC